MKLKTTLLFSLMMACGGIAHGAESKNNTLPGNPDLPSSPAVLAKLASLANTGSSYKVEDFFTLPEVGQYRISPDGKYLSWRKRNAQGKRDIWIKNVATGKEQKFITEGDDVLRGYGWINNDTLVYMQDKGGDENYHIHAKGLNDKTSRDLTPFDGVRAMINNSLKDDKAHIIIQMNKDNRELFEPYRLNVDSGKMEKLYSNPASEEPIDDFTFDKDGNLRIITRIVNGMDSALYYNVDGKFKKIKDVPFGENFYVIAFDENTKNPDDAYVVSDMESDKSKIYRYDLKKNTVIEEVFSHSTYDAGSVILSRKRGYELDAITYNGEKPQTVAKSKTYKAWMRDLEKQLGTGNEIEIIDSDDDERKMMVYVSSDQNPGSYYLYDTKTKKLDMLTKLFPHLKRQDMSKMTPISFKSRDGLDVHGYFSRPASAKKGEKVPVVVIVHGGPQGVRDSWGFNPEVQLLTSQGYGVLQVNFRVSGGYGKNFYNAGIGEVGRKAMDDVEDGVQYIIDKGWADPERVAIYGGSHGGFAVLRGLIKTPDLYACGVDYVGVSNLYTFMKTLPPYWESYRKAMYKIWYDPENPEQRKIMDEVSPLQNADKITKPLYVIQGANDPRVNINEADQIVESLRKRGVDVPYMVKYDEGHGFAKEANRLDMYRTTVGFFHNCLAEGSKTNSVISGNTLGDADLNSEFVNINEERTIRVVD